MGSTRLPGKIMLPFGDSAILDYSVSRCRKVERLADVLVATSTLPADDAVEAWCKKRRVTCFRGSQDDVLSRYYDCARQLHPDYVIRVTSDCPFIDFNAIDAIIDIVDRNPCDIVVYDKEPARGLWSEIVSYSALEYMYLHGNESRHREHVTFYAYEHPKKFKQEVYKMPELLSHPELRITLDTPEDYNMLKEIAKALPDMYVSSTDVVRYLLDHPEISALNGHIKQKPVT